MNACIEWKQSFYKNGYGRLKHEGKGWSAHRFAYFVVYGAPPAEKPFVLHKCNNRACWNPSHLYAGDAFDNMRDSVLAGTHRNTAKETCPKGHRLIDDNLIPWFAKRGVRSCKTCYNKRQLVYMRNK